MMGITTQTMISLLPLLPIIWLLQHHVFVDVGGVALAFTITPTFSLGRTSRILPINAPPPPAATSTLAISSPHLYCMDKRIVGNKRAAGARIKCTELQLSLSKQDDDDTDVDRPDAIDKRNGYHYHEVSVAGVSVSPKGFLVILQQCDGTSSSSIISDKKVAFPIQLTCASPQQSNDDNSILPSPSPSTDTDSDCNSNATATTADTARPMSIPSLFQENIDQTSVTTPEALTFLQLLNGVDMATPILGPDTLSLICVWYAFLLEEKQEGSNSVEVVDGNDNNEGEGEDGGLIVEDELGLLSVSNNNNNSNDDSPNNINESQSNKEAINYIKAMVRTTLPPSPEDGDDSLLLLSYMDASPWQRARVQLPRVWLNGVRLQEVGVPGSETAMSDSIIGSVPIQYILECSVDDGSKLLEIPLFAIPTTTAASSAIEESQSLTMKQKQKQLDISNEILQEISHNFNAETSASFLSLALFHRYNKSGGGAGSSADNIPTLKVSDGLLNQLAELNDAKTLLKKECRGEEGGDSQYCWTTASSSTNDGGDDDTIDAVIRNNGLPFYRSLCQIQEEDQRVLQHLEEQNFGNKDKTKDSSSGGDTSSLSLADNIDSSKDSGSRSDGGSNQPSSSLPPPPQQKAAAALTLEQQALQQTLKSAWKIALQRNDTGALEKIQGAMEDLERQVMDNEKRGSILDDGNCRAKDEGKEDDISSVDKIRRAMQQSSKRDVNEEEGVPGLISELEEATMSVELDGEKEEEQ